jgi:hypothetical protein
MIDIRGKKYWFRKILQKIKFLKEKRKDRTEKKQRMHLVIIKKLK